ncbi:MAG: ribosome-associated translation inhibitor RaiA [Candidatus Nomurabacteria bacterium]|nr:ribosome-associated translation inhibitor RaiA [Candidatus Nomurabacteria bacterium]
MQTNIQGKNIEIIQDIKDFITKKASQLEKFTVSNEDNAVLNIELSKTTNHHKHGEIWRTEINLSFGDKKFFAGTEKDDVYKSISSVFEDIERNIIQTKNRDHSLFIRGARSVKKMMKGLSKRNPFTAKY